MSPFVSSYRTPVKTPVMRGWPPRFWGDHLLCGRAAWGGAQGSAGISHDFLGDLREIWFLLSPCNFPFNILQHPSTSFNILQHPSIPFNRLWDNKFEQIERFTYWITLIWVYLQPDVWFIPSYIVNLKLTPKPLQLTVRQTHSLSFPSIYNNSHSLFKFINERKIINNWLWANH